MRKYLANAFIGPAQSRANHQRALLEQPGILSGMNELQAQCPVDPSSDNEEPIFLLSAGWRSGSTLLQRLIMSDSNVLIWGEPYDECGMIQALANSTQAFRPGWPPTEYYYTGTPPNQLSGEWIANLFPSLEELRKAHRAFFDTMFAEPARQAGAIRWGIKEVRLGIEHAYYLSWIYPKARFIFLYRNPLDAYQSYCRYGRNWYNIFPDKPVFTPTAFGSHWRTLMAGFVKDAKMLDALLIRYEDLVDGKQPLGSIEQFLGIQINHGLLNIKVGSSERCGDKNLVNKLEKWLLKRAVHPMASELGYTW